MIHPIKFNVFPLILILCITLFVSSSDHQRRHHLLQHASKQATTNRKLRDTVALELSFVNSNLQLLKEQLAELNSSVEIYQNNR